MSTAIKKTIFFVVLLLVFGGLIAFNLIRAHFISQFEKNFIPAPVVISSSSAKNMNYQPRISSVGSVVAINGVTVTPELSGIVEQINFVSGETVKQGQPLIQLDTDLDEQDLKNNVAKLNLDKMDFERKKKLYQTGAIAVSDYDQALSILQQTQAIVDKDKVTIEKKNIKAPFTGKLGIRQVNLGQFLNPGDAIVTLQQIDPVYVNFNLPQQHLPQLHLGQKVAVESDLYPGQKFYGKITAINAQVTEQTRNIEVQATLPNPAAKLYPGIFVNTDVYLPQQKNAVMVPQTAVSFSLYGDVVYVLKPTAKKDKTSGEKIYSVTEKNVTVGDSVDNNIIIKKGISAGDVVVDSGQLKLENGTLAIINNEVQLNQIEKSELDGGA